MRKYRGTAVLFFEDVQERRNVYVLCTLPKCFVFHGEICYNADNYVII